MFGSLQRAGQRAKAERYVSGLLALPERRTLCNIATRFDGAAAQQSVHHFIGTSPWKWMPIRHALARRVQRVLTPQAWIIASIVIPKVGPHSTGVDQLYLSRREQSVNEQHAVGTWLAADRFAVPVDRRLRLTGRWLEDPLRRRAGMPDSVTGGTLEQCVRDAVAHVVIPGDAPLAPVVVDVDGIDAVTPVRSLSAMNLVCPVRVGADAQLRLNRAHLPRYGDRERTAGELAASLTRLRQRVNPGDGPTTAAATPVVAPPPGTRAGGLTLVAKWPDGPGGARLWLTAAEAPAPASLLRLTRLASAVERDFTNISQRVGMADFAGRSFPGWHRHIILSSVAHLVAAISRLGAAAQACGRPAAGELSHNNLLTVR